MRALEAAMMKAERPQGRCFCVLQRSTRTSNCTIKHQATSSRFKPTVRILKNMRNAMISDGYLEEGLAPSYFLEGMLYNVPNGNFGQSYVSTVTKALDWVVASDRSKLLCANQQYYFCHPTSLVTWRAEKLRAYLDAAVRYWKDW